MKKLVKTLIYGKANECQSAETLLFPLASESGCSLAFIHVSDLDDLEQSLTNLRPTLLMVVADGAEGMECVTRCQERHPGLPIFWFSNDRDFAVQSHRLQCAYFSTKPVTSEKLANALRRCHHTGINYSAEPPV